MKTLKIHLVAVLLSSLSFLTYAQTDVALVQDQNPNFQKSMDKYMAKKDEILKNQGETIQDTYTAIDELELLKQKRALRAERRYNTRLARINQRGSWYRPYGGYGVYGSNFGYGYGYPYYSQPYGGGYYGSSYYFGGGPLLGLAALGLGAYWLLR